MCCKSVHFLIAYCRGAFFCLNGQGMKVLLLTILWGGLAIPVRSMAQSKMPSKEWIQPRLFAGINVALATCYIRDRNDNLEQVSANLSRSLSKNGLTLAYAQAKEVVQLSSFLYEKINKSTCDWDPGYLEAGIGTWLRSNGWVRD